MNIDWGDIATWFTGIITAGSLWVGFLILRTEQRRAQEAQASLVSAWYVDQNLPRGAPLPAAKIAIRNSSNLPLYGVRLYLLDDVVKVTYADYYVGTILPETTKVVDTDNRSDSLLPPDAIDFRDAYGRAWRRTNEGRLLRMNRSSLYWAYRRTRRFLEHPFANMARVLPGSMPLDSREIESGSVQYAIARATAAGKVSEEKAFRAIQKYLNGRRLSIRDKRIVRSAYGRHNVQKIGRGQLRRF